MQIYVFKLYLLSSIVGSRQTIHNKNEALWNIYEYRDQSLEIIPDYFETNDHNHGNWVSKIYIKCKTYEF